MLHRSVNLKTNFSWNSIAQNTNEILAKILPFEGRTEFFQTFCSFFGQWSLKKKYFGDWLTFSLLVLRVILTYFHGQKQWKIVFSFGSEKLINIEVREMSIMALNYTFGGQNRPICTHNPEFECKKMSNLCPFLLSHCYFTRLNLKKMGPFKFYFPVFLGINRHPPKKCRNSWGPH